MQFRITLSILCAANIACTCGEQVLLNGNWTLHGSNVSVNAIVPGCVYTDLHSSGIIGNPLYRMNDVEYRWIGLTNWSYVRKFDVSQELLHSKGIDLVCNGLDTVASIQINEFIVGNANNMHRKYIYNIKEFLKPVENFINVTFASSMLYKSEQKARYPYDVPPEPHFNFIRKAAYSFGWDWGPSFPSVGIWKDIYIETYIKMVLRDVKIQTFSDNESWTLIVTSYFDLSDKTDGAVVIQTISLKQLNITRKEVIYLKPSSLIHETLINLSQAIVDLWWPNGMGEAKLYEVKIDVCDDSKCEDSRLFRVGFRTVELIQENVNDSHGLTFYFKINGIPVFCKGSNWIPAGSFQGSIDKDQMHWLLESSANANMNILRVWGGGVYELDEFYDLADQLGIMVWQDFMFACAFYPTNLEFLETVSSEVAYQVRRLSHHPSIIIWSGNNENEVAFADNWFEVPSDMMDVYRKDYIDLYVDYMGNIVLKEDLSRPYITSSPSNGLKTIIDGWLSLKPQDEKYGDIHFYSYSIDGWNPEAYRIPRFASEFGFQSWPSLETLQPISLPEDLQHGSNFTEHRQRHANGNFEMETQVELHVKLPCSENKTSDFVLFVYLTQVDQAMCVKTQVEHYRRHQTSIFEDGRGMTMGAMYWQLNDVWQAPTWSSIEYGGKWKMLHYFARKFFATHLVSPVIKDGWMTVYFIKDEGSLDAQCNDFSVKVHCFNFHQFQLSRKWDIQFHQSAAVGMVFRDYLSALTSKCGCSRPRDCFFKFQAFSTCDNKKIAENFLFVENYFYDIPVARVTVRNVTRKNDNTLNITLGTNHFALFVWLEATTFTGTFSDNGFIVTNTTWEVTYTSRKPIVNVSSFYDNLKVYCLSDTLN